MTWLVDPRVGAAVPLPYVYGAAMRARIEPTAPPRRAPMPLSSSSRMRMGRPPEELGAMVPATTYHTVRLPFSNGEAPAPDVPAWTHAVPLADCSSPYR